MNPNFKSFFFKIDYFFKGYTDCFENGSNYIQNYNILPYNKVTNLIKSFIIWGICQIPEKFWNVYH